MKNKTWKLAAAALSGCVLFMLPGWSFFQLIISSRGKMERKLKKQRWFGMSHVQVNHPRHKFEAEYEAGKEWCRQQEMRDCEIKSVDGLTLHALYFPAENEKRIVLLSHGYRGTAFGDFAYMARFLHEHGCSLLFIDQRCCGRSEGNYITFGAKEQYDIQQWAFYLAEQNKKDLPVYLYGESMGAAAVLMASGHVLPKEVRGIIADCGFSSMRGQLRELAAEWFHIKWIELLLFRVNLFCRLLAGFWMGEADTAAALKKNKRPVLFFHGERDTYVNADNSKRNFALCTAQKELVVVKDARHLCSAYEAPQLYQNKIMEFFERNETGRM